MIEFFKALQIACSSAVDNNLYTLLGGRFSYGEATHGWSYPYGVYFGVTMTPDDTFSEDIEDTSFQVNIYSESRVDAMQLGQLCADLYDELPLSGVTGYKDFYIRKTFITLPWKEDDVWVVSIEFETLLQTEN